eukprot:763875-Hanusia_phi.AAC.2
MSSSHGSRCVIRDVSWPQPRFLILFLSRQLGRRSFIPPARKTSPRNLQTCILGAISACRPTRQSLRFKPLNALVTVHGTVSGGFRLEREGEKPFSFSHAIAVFIQRRKYFEILVSWFLASLTSMWLRVLNSGYAE